MSGFAPIGDLRDRGQSREIEGQSPDFVFENEGQSMWRLWWGD